MRIAFYSSLPQLDGSAHLQALHGTVTVERDTHGVPSIKAGTLDDLITAQAWVTAQDRLWQMDILRRNARGELAEVLGSRFAQQDRVQRNLLIRKTAEEIAGRLPPSQRHLLETYAAGVNQYIVSHKHNLPAEFRLLRYQPRPWQVSDSVAIALSMAQMLDSRFRNRLAREAIEQAIHNPQMTAVLYPTGSWRDHPPGAPVVDLTAPQAEIPEIPLDETQRSALSKEDGRQGEAFAGLAQAFAAGDCGECALGSNGWVVSGAHTASHQPILANDMHLQLGIPDIWYECVLAAPGLEVAGVSLPGIPLIQAGHNAHIAWGFTAMYGDTQDLYVETLDAQGRVLTASGPKPVQQIQEHIVVRGGRDQNVTIRVGPHGPMLDSAWLTPLSAPSGSNPATARNIALRWNIYDRGFNSLPVLELNTATDWESFRQALSTWWAPTLNVMYADDQGHIGYQAAGRIPLRASAPASVPIAGTDAAHEWSGYLDFASMPTSFDPANGILATANARITPDDFPTQLSVDWAAPYRNERIWKVLAAQHDLKAADMRLLQLDVYSDIDLLLAQRMAYALDHANPEDKRLRQAADILRTWNGEVQTSQVAPSIVAAASSELWRLILEPHLGDRWKLYAWPASSVALEELATHSHPEWLPKGINSRNQLLAEAVRLGLEHNHAPRDLNNWTWGKVNTGLLQHPLYSQLPWFRTWTSRGPFPMEGDLSTVRTSAPHFGSSQRFVLDWGDPKSATENLAHGQSGNPRSQYYSDHWIAWYSGQSYPLPWPGSALRQPAHRLRLDP